MYCFPCVSILVNPSFCKIRVSICMFFFFLLRERPTKAQKVITFTYIKKLEGSQQGAACLYITSNTMTTQNLKKPSSLLPPPLPSLLSQSATDYRLIFFCSLHYFSPTIWCLFDLKLYFFFFILDIIVLIVFLLLGQKSHYHGVIFSLKVLVNCVL